MKEHRHRRRSDLFLVRVWSGSEQAISENDNEITSAHYATGYGEHPEYELHGRVQRVTDGESHPFDSRQDLLNILNSMVSGSIVERGQESRSSWPQRGERA